jgi:hypothetical protein
LTAVTVARIFTHMARRIARVVAGAIVTAGFALLPASARALCFPVGDTGLVVVRAPAPPGVVHLFVREDGALVTRAGDCRGATVATTRRIVFHGSATGFVVHDVRAFVSPDGDPIHFSIDATDDSVLVMDGVQRAVVGERGIDLGADGSSDVSIEAPLRFVVLGTSHLAGDISGQGGPGVGGPARIPLFLAPGSANTETGAVNHGPDTNAFPQHFVGGEGNDQIYGSGADDDLHGAGGNDLIRGSRGLDVLDGGPGDDHLDGGNQADELTGGPGHDELLGGQGADLLLAADGEPDVLDGGPSLIDAARADGGLDVLTGVEILLG